MATTLKDLSLRTLEKSTASSRSVLDGLRAGRKENLGTLKKRASVSGEVTSDRSDTYKFSLANRSTLKLTLDNDESAGPFDFLGTKKRVSATLRDVDLFDLKSTERVAPDKSDDFKIKLNKGTYYVRIDGRSEKEVEYSLELKLS